jgi:hypothetical protein
MKNKYKELRGKITDPVSGISLTLPHGWSALHITPQGKHIFLIQSDKELGGMTFSITPIMPGVEGKKVEIPDEWTVETGEEGLFYYRLLHIKDQPRDWGKIWKRFAGNYEITIMYQWAKRYEYELETVNKIIETLHVPEVLKN